MLKHFTGSFTLRQVFNDSDADQVRIRLQSKVVDLCDAIALASMSKALKTIGIDTIASSA